MLARINLRLTSRNASTSTKARNSFPFPKKNHPTPHQIFHLPPNASDADIKARYFDLVRIYHPDKVGVSVSPDVAHAQFQSITAAYDALRNKATAPESSFSSSSSSPDSRYSAAAAYARSRRKELYSRGDDRWKDRMMLVGIVATIAVLVTQTFTTRRQALAEAAARNRHPDATGSKGRQTPIALDSLHEDDSDRRLSD